MKIRTKLLVIPTVCFFFLLILLVTVYSGMAAQRRAMDNIYMNRFRSYATCADLYEGMLRFHAGLYRTMAWSGAGYDSGKIGELAASQKTALEGLAASLKVASASVELGEEAKKLYEKAQGQFAEYEDWAGRALGIVESDLSIANMFMGTAEDKMQVLQESLASLTALEKKLGGDAYGDAAANSDFTLSMTIGIFLIAIVSSVAVSLFLSRRIMRSLKALSVRAEDISKGSGDLTQTIDIGTSDEIGRLGQSLNEFIAKLEASIANIKKVSEKSREIGGTLRRIAIDTTEDTCRISGTLNSSRESMRKLDGEIQGTAAIVDQITRYIGEMAKSVENQAAAVTQSSASVEEIAASIRAISSVIEQKKELSDRLSTTAREGLEKMAESSQAIEKVSRSADAMVGMVDVINGITSNLDLLAMNAAIEAAHAGESGRGFAVVAEEVRKLAEETASNAKSIAETLQATVGDMQSATHVNQQAREAIEGLFAGVREMIGAMDETRNGMGELSAGSSEIVKAIESLMEVTTAIRERSAAIDENARSIDTTMTRVSGLSSQTSTGMEDITSAVFHASESMTRLSEIGKANEESVTELDLELSRFKTG